jgi:predicted pyridoxine 5'-phosphate oxidase superfamily flavin-nucleotide-binding protein
VIPDRPGNNLAFGLTNIVETGRVGLLCIVPGTTETLRINGRAELTRDPDLLERLAVQGKPALLGIRVHVEEVFFHCAKAFIRSKLWKHETWPPKKKVSFGRMLATRIDPGDEGGLADLIDDAVAEDYRSGLY